VIIGALPIILAVPHFLEPLLSDHITAFRLYVEGRDTPVASVIETAFDSASRKKGLLGREALPEGGALVIAPCSAVHTFSMRFAIDLVFARRDGRVIKIRQDVRASRISVALGAFAVVEMNAGSVERTQLKVGDRLVVH
jgi:hypothetical protein